MKSKFLYGLTSLFLIVTLFSCELFSEGYGDKADLREPELTIDGANGEYKSGTFTLSGTATDDKKLSRVDVKYTSPVDNQEKSIKADLDKGLWSVTIDSTDPALFKNQEIDFFVTAKDKAGKKTSQKRLIYIDNIKPTVLVTTPAIYVDKDFNDKISVTAITADNYNVSSVKVDLYSESTGSVVLSGNAVGPSEWTFDLDTLSTQETKAGQFYLMVTATDLAGLTNDYFYHKFDVLKKTEELGKFPEIDDLVSSANRAIFADGEKNISDKKLILNIDQQSDYPVIGISNWDTDGMNNFDNNIYLTGQVTDDDGLAQIKVTIKQNNTVVKEAVTSPGVQAYNLNINLEAASWPGFTSTNPAYNSAVVSDGSYVVLIEAKDINGDAKITTESVLLGVDKEAPKVTIDFPEDDYFFNMASVNVSGTASDDVMVASLYLYINGTKQSTPVTVANNGTWATTIDTSANLDKFIIRAEVTDGVDKRSYETVNIFKDIVDPVIKNVVGDSGDLNGEITISGITDERNIDSTTFYLDGTPIDPADSTDNIDIVVTALGWDVTIDTTALTTTTASPVFKVEAFDKAGNSDSYTKALTIDQESDKPTVVFKTPDGAKDISGNSFSGGLSVLFDLRDDDIVHPDSKDPATLDITITDITDDIEANHFNVPVKRENLTATDLLPGDDSNDPVSFKYNPPSDSADPAYLKDGDYRITVTVKDYKAKPGINGQTSLTEPVKVEFEIDSDGPILTVDPSFDSFPHFNSNFTINGTVDDTKGAVKKIVITPSFGNEETIEGVDLAGNWSQLVTIKPDTAGKEDSFTIKVEAFDNAGNSSGVIEKTFAIDRKDPVEEATLLSPMTDLNGIVTLKGVIAETYLDDIIIKFKDNVEHKFSEEGVEVKHTWAYEVDTKDTNLFNQNGVSTDITVAGVDRAGNSVARTYTLVVDQATDKPTYIFDLPLDATKPASDNQLTPTSTISGKVSDDDGVDASTILIDFVDVDGVNTVTAITPTAVSGDGKNVTWSLDFSSASIPQGIYEVYVYADDDPTTKTSDLTVISSTSSAVNIAVDEGDPKLENLKFGIGDYDATTNSGVVIAPVNYSNDKIFITGDASDGLGLQKIEVFNGIDYTAIDSATVSSVKSYAINESLLLVTNAEVAALPAGQLYINTEVVGTTADIKIRVTDDAGNTTESIIPVVIDRDSPILAITSPSPNENVLTTGYTVRGTVTDGSGIGISELQYRTKIGTDPWSIWKDIENKYSWTIVDNDFTGDDGDRKIEVRAWDGLNVEKTQLVTFYHDNTAPTLIEDGINLATQVYKSGAFTLKGSGSDSVSFKEIVVTATKDGVATAFTPTDTDATDTGYNYEVVLPGDGGLDGDWIYSITAYDNAGNEKTVIRKVLIDETAPLAPAISTTQNQYYEDTINITGTSEDGGSGINQVQYSFDGSTGWTTLTGGDNWAENIDITSRPEGSGTIYVKAIDKAGNESGNATLAYIRDSEVPELTETKYIDETQNKEKVNVTLGGEFRDENGVTLTASKNGNPIALTITGENWSLPITTNGDATYVFTATDDSGKTTTLTRKVLLDKKAPTITLSNLVNNDVINSATFTIRGTTLDVKEDGFSSGVVSVEYDSGSGWQPVTSGTDSWMLDLNSTNSKGNIINFRATDNVGHTVETGNITYDVSLALPETTFTGISSTFEYINSDLTIGGTASDGNGIKSVTGTYIKDDGSSGVLTIGGTLPAWSSSLSTSDGIYDISIVVTDDVDETKTFTRKVGIDKSEPIINITSPSVNENVGNHTVRGTVTDGSGVGVDTLQYRVKDGAIWGDWTDITPIQYSWSFTYDFTGADGSRQIEVRAKDKLTDIADIVTAVDSVVFYHDNTAPTLNETGIGVSNQIYKSSTFNLTGTASDVVSFKDVVITATKDGTSVPFSVVDTDATLNGYNYEIALTGDGSLDGDWIYTITASDNAGNTSVLYRKILIDETAPAAPVVDTLSGDYYDTTVNISGTSIDTGKSGIDTVEYLLAKTQVIENLDVATNILTITNHEFSTNEIVYISGETLPTGIVSNKPYYIDIVDLNRFRILESSGGAIINFSDTGSDLVVSSENGRIWTPVTGTENWAKNIDISDVSILSGVNSVLVRASDRAGNVGLSQVFRYFKDIEPPKVNVTTAGPWGDNKYKNSFTVISGTASDDVNIATLTATGVSGANTGDNNNWSFPVSPVAGVNTITITATDDKGESTAKKVSFFFDANDPTLSGISITEGENVGLKTKTIIGSAADTENESGVALVEYNFNGTGWKTANGTEAWNVTLENLEEGPKTIQFQVTDRSGKTTTGSVINFNVDTEVPEIASEIYVDFDGDFATTEDTKLVVTNQAYRSGQPAFKYRFLVKDSIGVKFVTLNIPGLGDISASDTGLKELTYEIWETTSITLPALTEGNHDWKVTVTDTSDQTTTATRTVLIDNTTPTIDQRSPNVIQVLNGDVTIQGGAQDEINGSGLAKLQYYIGEVGSNNWEEILTNLYNWDIKLEGVNKIDTYAGIKIESIDTTSNVLTLTDHGYINDTKVWISSTAVDSLPTGLNSTTAYFIIEATPNTFKLSETSAGPAINIESTGSDVQISKYSQDGDTDGVWDLPITLRATDSAGNVTTDSSYTYTFKVNPDADKPIVTVVYPDPTEPVSVLGGTIRIFGKATDDDDGIARVEVQIDVNNDGLYNTSDDGFFGTDWYNNKNGQPAIGTNAWNITINENDEFNPINLADPNGKIKFRARAVDSKGVIGPWSSSKEIKIDTSVPKINPLTLVQGDTVKNYTAGMYIKGDWILKGNIDDDSGIQEAEVKVTINGNSVIVNQGGMTSNGNGYDYEIPIKTVGGTPSFDGQAGVIGIDIFAKDDTSGSPKTSQVSYTLNFDNKKPVMNIGQLEGKKVETGALSGALDIFQSDNSFEFKSSVDEGDSGFERVAFFVTREDIDVNGDEIIKPADDIIAETPRIFTLDGSKGAKTLAETKNLGLFAANTKPTADDPFYREKFTGGTVAKSGDDYTYSHAGLSEPLVRKGGLIKLEGLYYTIADFTGTTVTIKNAVLTEGTGNIDAEIPYALVVDNYTAEGPVTRDTAPANLNEITSITNDDGDMLIEHVKAEGITYTWRASINSLAIPDGPITITWVAFDQAGNISIDSMNGMVQNNRPRLAKVRFGTDLNADGTIKPVEKTDFFDLGDYNSDLDGIYDATVDATMTDNSFIAKEKSLIELDIVGGNGQLSYDLTEIGKTNVNFAANADSLHEIPLTVAELESIGEEKQTLNVKIWDSTEDTTKGTDSQFAKIAMTIDVDVIDSVPPKADITPFHWTNDGDNSLFNFSKDNGHIELEGNLDTTVFDDTTSFLDTDPKVSGQVSIRGTAYDDQRITALWMYIDNFGFTGSTLTGDQPTGATNTYVKVAEYTGGVWNGTDKWADHGWKFSVTSTIDKDGHNAQWQLDWDSSKITGVTKLNQKIRVIAEDKKATPNASPESNTQTVDGANTPMYQIDVVPYITGVSTQTVASGVGSGTNDQNIRSSVGEYSIKTGSINNYITVTGFNINSSSARISKTKNPSTTDGTAVTINTAATGPWNTIKLSNSIDRSGYLTLFSGTDNIPTLNNYTANIDYNIETDNIIKNSILTDDVYFNVFEVKDSGYDNGYYPNMFLDSDNTPVFGYLDLSAAEDLQVRRSKPGSYDIPMIRGTVWDQMAMTRDADGMYHMVSAHNRSGGQLSYMYNEFATMHSGSDYPSNAGAGAPYWSGYDGDYYYDTKNNALAFENTNLGGFYSGRFQHPKLITKGNSNTASQAADIYMLYYDASDKEIMLRTFEIGQSVNGTKRDLFVGTHNSIDYSKIKVNIGETDRSTTNELHRHGIINDTSDLLTPFFDFGVTSDNKVIVVYYDSNNKLVLRYSTGAVTGDDPSAVPTMSSKVDLGLSGAGEYLKAYVDGADVHIASYDSLNGDILYTRVKNATAGNSTTKVETVRIDQYRNVGWWPEIQFYNDNGTVKPIISYYCSTESVDSIRLSMYQGDMTTIEAGVDENGYVTGKWNSMTVPVNGRPRGGIPQFNRVNLSITSGGQPLVSYLADDIEWSVMLAEQAD